MIHKIGFSIKLDMDKDAYWIIDDYFKWYEVCELKLKQVDLESEEFEKFYHYVSTRYPNKITFHLPSDLLQDQDKYRCYLKMLFDKMKQFEGGFIVHVPVGKKNDQIGEAIIGLRRHVSPNSFILLENDNNLSANSLDVVFMMCRKYENVGVCFDAGHAMLAGEKEFEKYLKCITRKENQVYIKEVHVHNVINNIDHQPFANNCPAFAIKVISSLKCNYRLILEIKGVNPLTSEGLEQYKVLIRL